MSTKITNNKEVAMTASQLAEWEALMATSPRGPDATVVVSKAQAQMALFNAGLLDQLEVIIRNHPYRPVRIWYESANEWRRDNPYVAMMAPALDLSEEQIDALFVAAARL